MELLLLGMFLGGAAVYFIMDYRYNVDIDSEWQEGYDQGYADRKVMDANYCANECEMNVR